eukprot:COSAG01_NODE_14371_length_1462_cov_2.095378_1_plen_314_part_00
MQPSRLGLLSSLLLCPKFAAPQGTATCQQGNLAACPVCPGSVCTTTPSGVFNSMGEVYTYTCRHRCCSLGEAAFETMVTSCRADLRAHEALGGQSTCSSACLTAIRNVLNSRIYQGQVQTCRDFWKPTLESPRFITATHPRGQYALYEQFLAKCLDQQRQLHMRGTDTQDAVSFTEFGDYVIEAEAPITLNSKHPDAYVGVGKVDPVRKLDVAGGIIADRVVVRSLNGWNSTKLQKAMNLAMYLCGCDMHAVWYEAEHGRTVDPMLLGCGCSIGGTAYCRRNGKCECNRESSGRYTHTGPRCEQWITSGLQSQ